MESSSTASRLLSRESSAGNPSFRSVLYYGVASVAVPFLWESQPGTPKHADAAAALPPLTPPPSYFCTHTHGRSKKKKKTNKAISKSTFILPNLRKAPASFSSSSSSSSYDHEDSDDGSPTSTLCIGLCGRRPMKGPLLAP